MPTFRPPATKKTPTVFPLGTPGQTKGQYFARRRFSGHLTGTNVYRLTDGTITEAQPWDQDTIARIYFGGHIEPITDAESTALTDAGYGAYIT